MAEPIFNDTTERVYGQLPQHYREQDILQGYQFKKYLAGLLKSQDDVNNLIERLQFIPLDDNGVVGDTSDLVNPMTADAKWLPWLGQLFGTTVAGEISDDIRSEVVRASGFRAGTTDSIIAAAQTALVGTKKVRIIKHSDENWQPDMEEHIYRTNLAPLQSFEVLVSGSDPSAGSGGGATITRDSSWHQFGSYSCKIVSIGDVAAASAAYASSTSSAGAWQVNFEEGKTYTVSAYARLTAAHTTAGANPAARAISVGRRSVSTGVADFHFSESAAAPNAAGVTRLSTTFTVPPDTDATFVRLVNGSPTSGDTIWWDGVQIEESDVATDYMDGSFDTSGGYYYRWLGDPFKSPSQEYIPAVENTATFWDLLIMTLQSETLKNLLTPTLSKTLSPSVWEDDFESFGYNSADVWKVLVEQPGVYQNRALAYYLKDPTWQAGLSAVTGFGLGGFGEGTFGYGTDVTSTLRLTSRSSFPVVPTDSYQYMVSLGLKQDVIDEKRSAIGMKFFDDGGDLLTNVLQTNMYPDPSHEYSLAPMAATPTSGTGTLALDTSEHHIGAQSIAYTTTANGATYRTASTLGSPTANGMVVGDTVTLSFWVNVPAGVTASFGNIGYLGGTAFATAATIPFSQVTARDTWIQVHGTATVTNASGTITPRIYGGSVSGNKIWFDNFGVVKGNVVADFNGDTPDPVDGSLIYQWNGTAGASTSSSISDYVSTEIDVVPTIENTNIAAHNFVKSSKYANYSSYGSNSSAVDVTNFGKYANNDIIRATINSVATTSDFGIELVPTFGLGNVASGTTFTFTLDMYADVNASVNSVRVFFRDDTNSDDDAVDFNATTPPDVTLTKGRWHTRHWTATVKPGRTVTSAYILIESSVNQSQGAYFDTANWLIEEGTVSNLYFNGDTPPDDNYTYSWDGVPNASITNKVLTTIAAQNIVQMQQFNSRFVAPPNAATAKVFIDMDGFNGKDTLYIAQPATREEYDETWCAVSADIVQTVIDHNVKPAGVILHWLPIVSDWDTVTAGGTRPWSELELPWLNLEELGQ